MRKEYLLYRHLGGDASHGSTEAGKAGAAGQARLRLFGPDARRFLHGMVSNDIAGLKPGQGCHAALLTVKGKLLADLVVYDLGDFGLLIELVRSARDAVRASLERHLIMDDATVVDLTEGFGELGVYGPGAAAALASASGLGTAESLSGLPTYGASFTTPPIDGVLPTIVAATRDLGSAGFHVMAPISAIVEIEARLLAAGAHLLTEEAAEVLRVESGVPLYGRDLDEDRMPAEAGLDDAVSFSKGCYLGQEVVVRLRDRGHLNRKLCGLRLSEGPPVPAGARLRSPERPNAGTITSSVQSPRLGPIALGYVHRSAWEPGTTLEVMAVSSTGEETPLGRTAVVCPLPFPMPPASDPPTDR